MDSRSPMYSQSRGVGDLLIVQQQHVLLESVVLDAEQGGMLQNIIKEQHFCKELTEYGLQPDNKLLLYGASGCGKTMVAHALAIVLKRKLLTLNLSTIVNAKIGETAHQLKIVFDRAANGRNLLFLDEADLIGKSRSHEEKDVGELRRVVNTLLQLIDNLPAEVMLVAATNYPDLLDTALVRRFQVKIGFKLPASDVLDGYYDQILAQYPSEFRNVQRKYGISFAEARDSALTQVKAAVLAHLEINTSAYGAGDHTQP